MKSSNINAPYIEDVGCIYFIVKSFLLIFFYSSGNFSKNTNTNVAIDFWYKTPHYLKDEHKNLPGEPDSLKSNILLDTNDDGIILILQYLVDYERATNIKTALQRQILNEFDQNTNINFAVLDIRMLEK